MNPKLPLIDLKHGTKILGDLDNAKKILSLFIKKLPSYQNDIRDQRKSEDWSKLKESMHALKGATCYSSTPSLHHCFSNLDSMLANASIKSISKAHISKVDLSIEILNHHIQETVIAYDDLLGQKGP